MKRFFTLLLVLVMACGLTACGGDETPVYYYASGVAYAAALGEPMLGKAAAELAAGDIMDAAEQITNIGDAIYYMKNTEKYDQPYDACMRFAALLAEDYDEVGLIMLSCPDNGYTLLYIRQDDVFYPVDPFAAMRGEDIWSAASKADTDLNALCEGLMTSCPYNPNQEPMTSYEVVLLSSNIPWVPVTPEDHAIAYLTTPQYTAEQIEQWVAEDLTLDQWAEKIKVPADAVQMLYALDYNKGRELVYGDNSGFYDAATDTHWVGGQNAQTAFDMGWGQCWPTANLMNYLLAGDFDDQGYVQVKSNDGGHIFNYVYFDGMYVMCDFIGARISVLFGGNEAPNSRAYILYAGGDVDGFTEWYRTEGVFSNDWDDPSAKNYIYQMFLYALDGKTSYPVGNNKNSIEIPLGHLGDVFPLQHKEDLVILFEREGAPIQFVEVPPEDTWPAEIR